MPEMNDLTVEGDDAHGWTVRRLVQVNSNQSQKGLILGHTQRLSDGTYEPSGTGAMYGYPVPARTLKEALEAFAGLE